MKIVSRNTISRLLRRLDAENSIQYSAPSNVSNVSDSNAQLTTPSNTLPYLYQTLIQMLEDTFTQKNVSMCQLLINSNIHKLPRIPPNPSYLTRSIDIPEIFDLLLHDCTDPDVALETLYELIRQEDIPLIEKVPLIKKIIDKYNQYISRNQWEDPWKTHGKTKMMRYVKCIIYDKDEAKIQSLISTGLFPLFNEVNIQAIFNLMLERGFTKAAEVVRQIMVNKGYKPVLDLGTQYHAHDYTQPLLMFVPLPKLYDVVNYATQHCNTFNSIKNAYIELADSDDKYGYRRYLPETVLSYLAFVNQFDAMKLIIENSNCSFEPTHLVVCSLFRGHYVSVSHKLPVLIYDDIFDYLMRDNIRPRVLGDDKVWIDKSIFIAIRYGNERMVKKLVELGADLSNIFINSYHCDDRSTYARYSLLSYACEYQTADVVQFLIEKGVPIEGTMIDALGEPMIGGDIKQSDSDNDDDDNDEGNDDDNDNKNGNGKPDVILSFYFPQSRSHRIKKSLYPQYFDRDKINKNRDLDFLIKFDKIKHDSDCVYLLNMTPLGVAIYKMNMEIMKILLLHGANPMQRCMTNFPALFCLSRNYIDQLICEDAAEETDEEILERYPLQKDKENDGGLIDGISRDGMYNTVERHYCETGSHFTTTLATDVKCINIRSFLAEYSHILECQLHGSTTTSSKRQRRCSLDEVGISDDIHNHTSMMDLIVDIPLPTNNDENSSDVTITASLPPQGSGFVYRNNISEIFQLLIEYGAPAEYDTKKSRIVIQGERGDTFTPETLLESQPYPFTYAEYSANIILFFAKNSMITLSKFNELIDGCFSSVDPSPGSNTERVMNVCELLSAIIYPTYTTSLSDNDPSESSISPSTLDRKIALVSRVLDPVYSDRLYDIAIDKIYGSRANIEIFMRLIKVYPKFFSLNMQHSNGQSLLNHDKIVLSFQLVQLGLDVNQVTSQGDSLLLGAIKQENTSMIHRLISFGADIDAIGSYVDNSEFSLQNSPHSQSIQAFLKKCTRVVELLKIMNQYQSSRCICSQSSDNSCTYMQTLESPSTFQPFSQEDYELLASSCVPEYTFETLSYFFSSCVDSSSAVCSRCKQTLTKNDHCRPHQSVSHQPTSQGQVGDLRNGNLSVITYIHDECFFKNLRTMIPECMSQLMSSGSPRYIRNPTKRYDIPNIYLGRSKPNF